MNKMQLYIIQKAKEQLNIVKHMIGDVMNHNDGVTNEEHARLMETNDELKKIIDRL